MSEVMTAASAGRHALAADGRALRVEMTDHPGIDPALDIVFAEIDGRRRGRRSNGSSATACRCMRSRATCTPDTGGAASAPRFTPGTCDVPRARRDARARTPGHPRRPRRRGRGRQHRADRRRRLRGRPAVLSHAPRPDGAASRLPIPDGLEVRTFARRTTGRSGMPRTRRSAATGALANIPSMTSR